MPLQRAIHDERVDVAVPTIENPIACHSSSTAQSAA